MIKLYNKIMEDFKCLLVLRIIFQTLHFAYLAESIYFSALYSAEYAVTQPLVLLFKRCEKLFHFLSFSISVGRAGGFYHGKLGL